MKDAFALTFWFHFGLTWALTGVAWFIHRVHYPLLRHISERRFMQEERLEVRHTKALLFPAMCLELVSALFLWVQSFSVAHPWTFSSNLLLVAIIWGLTFKGCVPLHRFLEEKGWDQPHFHRLVLFHEYRLGLWSLRALLLLGFASVVGTI